MSDDETRDDAATPEKNDDGEWICPECGDAFTNALGLGAHRKQQHGVAGTSKRSQSRRRSQAGGTTGSRKQESRKAKIRTSLLDLANLADDLRGRSTNDLPEHLAEVIRRDADQLATMLAALADRVNPVKFVVDHVLTFIAPVTASSGVLRWLLRAWRRQLKERPEVAEELTLVEVADWRADVEQGRAEAADGG